MAGSVFEPEPCNFAKLDIFLRCSNDIISYLAISQFDRLEKNVKKQGVQHRRRFHNDFIQSTRSAPLRTVRVSKEAKLYKKFKFMEFLLYFWLRIEKTLKNCPKLAKVPSKWWFWDSFFNLIQFWLKSRAKIKQIQVLYNFPLHFTPQRAQGVYS